MSDAMVSVLDALDDPAPCRASGMRFWKWIWLSNGIWIGVDPDEWAVAQVVREATQAALHSMDNMAK